MPETAQRYRQRPNVVRAMQLTDETTMDLIGWLPTSRYRITDEAGMPRLWIQTAGGGFECTYLGQWVVHESDGFHLYSATQFERMYEPEPPRRSAVGYITGYRDPEGDWSIEYDGAPWATREAARADLVDAVEHCVPGLTPRTLTVYDEDIHHA